MLVREVEKVQCTVCYISQVLQEAKTRYTNLKNLAFALLITTRKLRPYLQSHPNIVVTNYPLRHLNGPNTSGRLAKQALELGVIGVSYVPRSVIKAEALVDFIAKFTGSMPTTFPD